MRRPSRQRADQQSGNSRLKRTAQAGAGRKNTPEMAVSAMSHSCIDATVRTPVNFRYRSIAIDEACATRDLEFYQWLWSKNMKFIKLLSLPVLLGSTLLLGACTSVTDPASEPDATASAATHRVTFQQIRNATIKLDYADTTFLVDPMLAPKGAYPGFEGTRNSELRYPLVDLPLPVSEVLDADAIILTHLHDDHWDLAARNLVPRDMPIFTQNEEDAITVRKDGFTDVRVLTQAGSTFNDTKLYKTGGQHGSDAMYAIPPLSQLLGKTMGIIFQQPGYKTVYVAGDTIWRDEVEAALALYQPDVIVLNTGYAQLTGFDGSIIMGKDDLYRAYQLAPNAQVIGSHMDTVNHTMQTRAELRRFIAEKNLDSERALVPDDGESYQF